MDAISLDRMISAVEQVRQRLLKTCRALDEAGVKYAVAGGNAVAAWVSTVDEAATRNTRDVDVMINRGDLEVVRQALEKKGFTYRHVAGLDVFLEEATGSVRDAIHLIFAGELVRPGEPALNPDLSSTKDTGEFKILSLQALVQIKLTAFRDKDRVHLRDLIDVGLVDSSWLSSLPEVLAIRLQALLSTPDG